MLLRGQTVASRVLRLPLPAAHTTSTFRQTVAGAASGYRTNGQLTRFCTSSLSPGARSFARPGAIGLQSELLRAQRRSAATASKEELDMQKHRVRAHPEQVSSGSTTHPVFGEVGREVHEEEVDMMAGIKQDMKTIRETFNLSDVPREAYVLGLAGVLPYVTTSAGTIYACWEMHHAATYGSGFLMSGAMAESLLHILGPLQIGYGAAIISFLGAIHWGLEWAGFGGKVGYPRYMIGVIAPAIAWPTTLLADNTALIFQFLGFTYLYYADSRACAKGWAPSWYGMYRFVLTCIVGASIVASLIGRGEIAHMVGEVPKATQRIQEFRETAKEELSKSEQATRAAKEQRQSRL